MPGEAPKFGALGQGHVKCTIRFSGWQLRPRLPGEQPGPLAASGTAEMCLVAPPSMPYYPPSSSRPSSSRDFSTSVASSTPSSFPGLAPLAGGGASVPAARPVAACDQAGLGRFRVRWHPSRRPGVALPAPPPRSFASPLCQPPLLHPPRPLLPHRLPLLLFFLLARLYPPRCHLG